MSSRPVLIRSQLHAVQPRHECQIYGAFIPLLEARLTNGWPLLEPVGPPMPPKISKPISIIFVSSTATQQPLDAPKALELAVDFFGAERVLFDPTLRLIFRMVAYSSRRRSARWT